MQGPGMLIMMALPLLLLVFMTRSQSKKQKELEASLKVGDKVVTSAGLIGKIVDLGERTARIEIAPGVNVQMLKTSIQGPDQPPDAAKDADKSKEKEASKEKEKK
jgi:preprotein translocase subunit YajC